MICGGKAFAKFDFDDIISIKKYIFLYLSELIVDVVNLQVVVFAFVSFLQKMSS